MNEERKQTPEISVGEDGAMRRRAARGHNGHDGGGHRRWLFLLVDVLLLAAIVASVIFLVVLLSPVEVFGDTDEEVRELTYTVELAGVEQATVEALQPGDTVIDKETGAVIGTIFAIEPPRPYTAYTDQASATKDPVLDKHTVVKVTYPDDLSTVVLTVTVSAEYLQGVGYTVDGCRVAVGREYELCFPAYTCKGVCVALDVKEAE